MISSQKIPFGKLSAQVKEFSRLLKPNFRIRKGADNLNQKSEQPNQIFEVTKTKKNN